MKVVSCSLLFPEDAGESRTFDWYSERASSTNTYPRATMAYDLALGLCSEAGEVAGKLKKIDRDQGGVVSEDARKAVLAEVGDVLWYCSQLAEEFGSSLGEVAEANVDKLASRKARGRIGGSGDER